MTDKSYRVRVVDPDPAVELSLTLKRSQWALLVLLFGRSSHDLARFANREALEYSPVQIGPAHLDSDAFMDFAQTVYEAINAAAHQ